MAKTDTTIELERNIYSAIKKQGVFCCFEVSIGIGWIDDQQRVDMLTYDTKGIWRCFEIKASKSDFHSKAKKTFIGHFNYYVLTHELYEQVKEDIPAHIGVYVGSNCVKKARKQELGVDEQVLKDSLIRSLSRETDKILRSENPAIVESLNRRIRYEQKEKERYREMYQNLMREANRKFGTRWRYD